MLDRRDNISVRTGLSPTCRVGRHTFEQNRNRPAAFTTFESIDLEYEAMKSTLDDSKHYPGVGNDVQKLQNAVDNLENIWQLYGMRKTRC